MKRSVAVLGLNAAKMNFAFGRNGFRPQWLHHWSVVCLYVVMLWFSLINASSDKTGLTDNVDKFQHKSRDM